MHNTCPGRDRIANQLAERDLATHQNASRPRYFPEVGIVSCRFRENSPQQHFPTILATSHFQKTRQALACLDLIVQIALHLHSRLFKYDSRVILQRQCERKMGFVLVHWYETDLLGLRPEKHRCPRVVRYDEYVVAVVSCQSLSLVILFFK